MAARALRSTFQRYLGEHFLKRCFYAFAEFFDIFACVFALDGESACVRESVVKLFSDEFLVLWLHERDHSHGAQRDNSQRNEFRVIHGLAPFFSYVSSSAESGAPSA